MIIPTVNNPLIDAAFALVRDPDISDTVPSVTTAELRRVREER